MVSINFLKFFFCLSQLHHLSLTTEVWDLDRVFAQKGLCVLVDFNKHCSLCNSYFIQCSRIIFIFFWSSVNKVIKTVIMIGEISLKM